ncbi:MAG TPA: hypothetical protein VFT06_01675 [Flavisolibacter sp.]|nr:hypothetical protein [Flavisolibacter sp.]
MTINDYKAALKNMIDATDDESLLQRWKMQLETEFDQYLQRNPGQAQQTSLTEPTAGGTTDNDKDSGYVVIESGLGIDE